ncbi:cuticle protein 21-like [Nilaparvata lugens]|uniref:cuticle protein 21-like n=1 Tax=Nilaparvata lugens TaxID=108931 RepID=UPI00193D153F|nr:cuticle protein 21-like [Nilaparvata lugens]
MLPSSIMDKVTFITVCVCTLFPSSIQQSNYSPTNVQDNVEGQYKDEAHLVAKLGLPVYKSSTPPTLSKLFKPRPAALENYFVEEKSPQANEPLPLKYSNPVGKTGYASPVKHLQNYNSPQPFNSPGPRGQQGLSKYSSSAPQPSNYLRPDNSYRENEIIYQDEPANYEFTYEVVEPQYYLQFGHRESRQGDVARGSYHVLLPDGRTQVVEYQADENGYRPTVTYQQKAQPAYDNRY